MIFNEYVFAKAIFRRHFHTWNKVWYKTAEIHKYVFFFRKCVQRISLYESSVLTSP